MTAARGTLVLVPAPLDFGMPAQVPIEQVLPAGTLAAASRITHWIAENAKTARAFLKRIDALHPLAVALQQQAIVELPREVHKKGDHHGGFDARPLLRPALDGHDVGLLSEAGMPAVADPGSSVVLAAHDMGLRVLPLTGPVSLLLALAASGLNGQNFAFVGYVPQDAAARMQRLRELEALALRGQTQILIETPYRNAAVWEAMLKVLAPATRVAIAGALTLPQQQVGCRSVKAWDSAPCPVGNDTPAVFLIGK